MKMDEKQAKYMAEEFLIPSLEKIKDEGLITRYEISVKENTPIITVTCYFLYNEDVKIKHPYKKQVNRELYCHVYFSVLSSFVHNPVPIFLSGNPNFPLFKSKIISRINSRKRGQAVEDRAFKMMNDLKKENIGIVEVYRGSEYSDNKLKMDIIMLVERKMPKVFFDERNERFMIGFNVKSSFGGQKIHIEKNLLTPSISFDPTLPDEQIKKNVKNLIDHSLIRIQAKFLSSLIDSCDEYDVGESLKLILSKSKTGIHR